MSVLVFAVLGVSSVPAQKGRVLLKDGRFLNGSVARMSAIDEGMEIKGQYRIKTIVVVDDGLRKTFVPSHRVAQTAVDTGEQQHTYKIPQRNVADFGTAITLLGDYDTTARFDKYGRRIIGVRHPGGVEPMIQVITEINPRYVRAQAIKSVWDMRIATNAIPREVLSPIILNQLDDPENLEERKGLVRFYIQAELYETAIEEIDSLLRDFGDSPRVVEQLSPYLARVRSLAAERLLRELESRFQAGQTDLVERRLKAFETEDVPGKVVQDARRMLSRYEELRRRRTTILSRFDALLAEEKFPDAETQEKVLRIRAEMEAEINFNTISRFAMFELHANNPNYDHSQKLALAISGWFLGSNIEVDRLSTAVALLDVRELVARFLNETNVLKRQAILEDLAKREARSPAIIAKILAYMKPPRNPVVGPPVTGGTDGEKSGKAEESAFQWSSGSGSANKTDAGETASPSFSPSLSPSLSPPGHPGFYVLEREGFLPGDPLYKSYRYCVQLPPEYDPNRRYPAVVSLHGATTTPERQIDWWAGEWKNGERFGQATRHGYIVIAPYWNPGMLLDYDFSGMSHGAVLYTLKDALARFNIDTDHVYLSGHGIGGTAAWDIGAAHPDLWAGVIPIGAVAGKYINIYAENMRKLPFYYVGGELEGVNMTSALKRNAPVFNKYLVPTSNPFEATVVLYRGRGSESFSDELLRLFDWMKRHTRDPVPKEFNVRSMRHWDDFFWQVELGDMSKDRKLAPCVLDPVYWPEKDSGINTPKNVVRVESKILPAVNAVRVKIAPGTDPVGGNPGVVVFLTPEMIDFEAKAEITVNDRPYHPVNGFVEPNIETILEDARTRCDRLHPFWVRLLKRGRE